MANFTHNATGGIIISALPQRNYNASFDFGFPNHFTVYGTGDPDLFKAIDINWTASAGKFYWYRVLGKCQSRNCGTATVVDDTIDTYPGININPDINLEPTNYCSRIKMAPVPLMLLGGAIISTSFPVINPPPKTPISKNISDLINSEYKCERLSGHMLSPKDSENQPVLLMAVTARDLGELCDKLQSPTLGPPFDFKLMSIKKYTTPIIEDGKAITSELHDEDFTNIPECMKFNVDFDFTRDFTEKTLCNNRFLCEMKVYKSFFYESNIVLNLSGSFINDPIIVFGFAEFDQVPTYVSFSSYVFPYEDDFLLSLDPAGALILSNELDFTINPLIRDSIGSIGLGGELVDFVTPIRKHESLLSLSVISQTKSTFIQKYNSYGFLSTNSAAVVEVKYNFLHEAIGSTQITGQALISSNRYFNKPEGQIVVSGSSVVVSGYRNYIAQGRLILSGEPNKLGMCFKDPSEIYISGSGESGVVYAFDFTGNIEISGERVGVVSPNRNYNPKNNNMNTGGDAELNFTNFGLLLMLANFKASYSNASIDSAQQNVNTLSTITSQINQCGCVSGPTIDLFHNVNNGGIISEFLSRNKEITFDTKRKLYYRKSTNSWIDSQTLIGIREPQIVWKFSFELSCTNVIENQTFDENYLKFNFHVNYRNFGGTQVSNIVAYINPNDICKKNGLLSVSIRRVFSIDTNQYYFLINDTPTNFYKFIDNIGMFANKYWNSEFNYSRLRPQYYPTTATYTDPIVRGIWPEFRLNLSNPEIPYTRNITLEV